jgi:hypothetical protein
MLEHELEAVLSRHLGRVKAPPELKAAPLSAPAAPTRRVRRWRQPLAAGIAAAAAVTVFLVWHRPPSSDLLSTDPTQMAAWLKSRSFDVPLRSDPPSSIRLTRARVMGTTAEIDYRVAGHAAVLTVSSPSEQAPDHGAYHVVRSHLVRGQLYTLACAFPQDAHTACLLCHMGAEVN